LAFEFLADGVEGMQRSDLYHCHEFVRAIAYLLEIKHVPLVDVAAPAPAESLDKERIHIDFIDEASRILRKAKRTDPQDMREFFEKEFDKDELAKNQQEDVKAAANGQADEGAEDGETNPEPPAAKSILNTPASGESQAGKVNTAGKRKPDADDYEKPGFCTPRAVKFVRTTSDKSSIAQSPRLSTYPTRCSGIILGKSRNTSRRGL
jgi:hypothetical protein